LERGESVEHDVSWTSLVFGYYLSTLVVEVVNKVSGGWLASNNLNRDKLNYFYWLLVGLSVVNLGVYMVCASWYRYKEVEIVAEEFGEEDIKGSDWKWRVSREGGTISNVASICEKAHAATTTMVK
ncbi:Protein NRT1/ PTR FAMILY 3.1, partial [Linum grandiflorum]